MKQFKEETTFMTEIKEKKSPKTLFLC